MTSRRLFSVVALAALPLVVVAQDMGPTAEDVQALQKKYQDECTCHMGP